MNFMNKLERKFGRYGIPNLTTYIILSYVVGYVVSFVQPALLNYLRLEPGMILFHFQIWRLFTWVLVPPGEFGIFTLIMLFFYYSLGNTLERNWGTFRYTLFILSGMLFTVVGAFLLYGILLVLGMAPLAANVGLFFSTYYVSLSIFLAFAVSFPDMQVLLYFVIPIRIKWLAYLDIALLAYDAFSYIRAGYWMMVVPIAASLLNVLIFFLSTRNLSHMRPKEVKRRQEFKRAVAKSQVSANGVTKHKCAVCGRTERDGDHLEFRFCSKCNGNFEYCQDHLFTHQHVK